MDSISREPERGRQTAFRHLLADAAETGPLNLGPLVANYQARSARIA
jgi:hypothetical protein